MSFAAKNYHAPFDHARTHCARVRPEPAPARGVWRRAVRSIAPRTILKRSHKTRSSDLLRKASIVALSTYLAIRLAVLVAASFRVRFVMDEMGLQAGFRYFVDVYRGFDPIKTVLATYYFNAPRLFLDESVALLRAGRALGLVLALTMVAVVAWVGFKRSGTTTGALLAAATLLTFSNFAERSFRIRTDGAAALASVVALAMILCVRSPALGAWLAGLASGVAFLCTQKAIFGAIALGLGLLVAGAPRGGGWRESLGLCCRFSAGWLATIVAYAIGFGGADTVSVLRAVFLSPGRFAVATFSTYEGIGRYRVITLQHNALLYAFAVVALVWVVRSWRIRDHGERVGAVAALTLIPLVFSHGQPWPYTFVALQLFLAPWPAIHCLSTEAGQRRRTIVAGALALAFALALPRAFLYPMRHTNSAQLVAIAEIEPLLAPADRYFDGLGMIPGRIIAGRFDEWWWDRPTLLGIGARLRSGDTGPIQRTLDEKPKLWLLNYRTAALMPVMWERLRESYVRVSPLVLLAGVEMPSGAMAREFLCTWPGTYRLFEPGGGSTGDPVGVSAGPLSTEVRIDIGRVVLHRASAERTVWVLPADTKLRWRAPAGNEAVPDLFAEVYDF